MTDNGPIEPSAALRTFAKSTYEMYVALTLEGFNEKQALTIIGYFVAAANQANGDDNG